MLNLVAQNLNIPGMKEPITGPIPQSKGFTNLASVVSQAVPILFAIAGVALLAYLLWGGFDYITSMGDPKKAETGKQKITYAVLGFVIIFASYWITQLVDYLFQLGIYS